MGQRDGTAIGKERAPEEVAAPLVWMQLVERLPQVDAFPKYVRALLEFIAGGSGGDRRPTRRV